MSAANDGIDPQALSHLEEMGIPKDDAIQCLKACKNDLNKAAEYYFGGELENDRNANVWDENVWTSERWGNEVQDPTPSQTWAPIPAPQPSKRRPDSFPSDPKSRPPSPDLGEDYRRAIKESLADSQVISTYGPQQLGTTASYTAHSNLRPARDVYYDRNRWALVPSVDQAVEIFLDPVPKDRMRKPDDPVFLKPSPSSSNLAPLLTILHSIPAAREELLCRNHTLDDYGQNDQWWMGHVIQLPKIISIEDYDHPRVDSQDIILETQRIMAFLDDSQRAYGTAESVASIPAVFDHEHSSIVPNFFKAWAPAAEALNNEPERVGVMHTTAVRCQPDFPELSEKFMCLEITIPEALVDNGNLYDCIDALLWSNDEENAEDYLVKLADVFTVHLKSGQLGKKGCGLDISAELYLDRYTEAFKDEVLQMKMERDAIGEEINRIDAKEAKLKIFSDGGGKPYDALNLMNATIDHLRKAEVPDILPQLQEINSRILEKLKELASRKESAREALEKLKSLATSPESVPEGSPPLKKYTLRGVTTGPSTTLMRKKDDTGEWLSIKYNSNSYGGEEEPTGSYEIQTVSEEFVLRAARFDGDGITSLVYASEAADKVTSEPLPEALKRFVQQDNNNFQMELQRAELKKSTGKKRQWWDEPPNRRDSSDNAAGPSTGGIDSGLATPGNSRRNSFSEDIMNGSTDTLMPPPSLPPPPPPPSQHRASQHTEMQTLSPSSLDFPSPPSGNSDPIYHSQEEALAEHVEHVGRSPSPSQKQRARLDLDM